MAEPTSPTGSSGSSLVPKIVLGAIAVVIVLTVIGWVVGAIISVLRTLVIVGAVLAVIWAVLAARGD